MTSLPSPIESPAVTSVPVTSQNSSTVTQQGSGTKSEQPTNPPPSRKPDLIQHILNSLTGGIL